VYSSRAVYALYSHSRMLPLCRIGRDAYGKCQVPCDCAVPYGVTAHVRPE
jgi:hypothetical protein